MRFTGRLFRCLLLACALLGASALHAQGVRVAGLKNLTSGQKLVLMPLDVELFSISGGGIMEPQAAWTEQAVKHLHDAYLAKGSAKQLEIIDGNSLEGEQVDGLNRLHGAVGSAIALHHYGQFKLPTKEGRFEWSLGPEVAVIREKTGADYALFTFVRDAYASTERKVAMFVGALLGVGLHGGFQVGYASMVDLRTGEVVWFNRLLRMAGDLREADPARETLEALLASFPG